MGVQSLVIMPKKHWPSWQQFEIPPWIFYRVHLWERTYLIKYEALDMDIVFCVILMLCIQIKEQILLNCFWEFSPVLESYTWEFQFKL